ncbi:multisubunit sodium/proton antiporter, MrpD subunit [Natronorubrum sediminis]|uniref:Multisubunit sodium/proton antiporter, MrpD subunit n=1 Tax=Natronorubrum sediminis TaxID=640943 RepID=A0A1H6FPX6_9EURY|nr:proton-conducting transporter membrane subunit [Natronorubrum sediminis]SEH11805.1 multisubunit sodium/proton antiporter, MrpD subunit [Natronorubrum sediminis]
MTEVHSLRPLATILIGFVAIAVVVGGRHRPAVRDGAPIVAALVTFGLVVSMVPDVMSGQNPTTNLGTLVAGVDLELSADPLGMLFALVASGLWVVTSIYSVGYAREMGLDDRTRYTAALCLSVCSGLGVAFASNLLVLVVFYELTTVGTYPLVAHKGTEQARRIGYEYVVYVIAGGTLVVGGTVLVYGLAGTIGFESGGIPGLTDAAASNPTVATLALGSLLIGFAVKGAVMPLHAWLPKAMVAPTTVSGVLHAVVVVKSGVFGIARTVLEVFGPEATSDLGMATPLAVAAGVTILLGSVLALRQDDLKRRLAYSTIAHLSYVVLGIALLVPAGVVGGLVHIPAHAVAKLALFFCVGALAIETDVTKVSEIAGVGRRMPLTMGTFAIGACSLAGIPLFAGFASKWYLLVGGGGVHPLVPALLVVSGALNVAYFWPIVYGAFFESPSKSDPKPLIDGPLGGCDGSERVSDGGHASAELRNRQRWERVAPNGVESRATVLLPLVALACLTVVLGVWPDRLAVLELAVRVAETSVGVIVA